MNKMKLGMETCTTAGRFGEAKAVEMFHEAGFDCFDFSFFSDHMVDCLGRGTAMEVINDVRAVMERVGICCNQTHAPMKFRFGDRMELDEPSYGVTVRAMECAAALGAKYIVVHSILTPAGVELVDYNLRFFKSLEKYCEKYNIQIGFENIFDYDPYKRCMPRFATARSMNDMLDRLASPWFVCCCDVGHAAIAGTKPEDFIRGMSKDTLRLLHIQDTDYMDDLHLLPYMAKQNWDEITSALAEIGYEGDFTFEIGKFFRPMENEMFPAALRFAEATGRHLIGKIEKARG